MARDLCALRGTTLQVSLRSRTSHVDLNIFCERVAVGKVRRHAKATPFLHTHFVIAYCGRKGRDSNPASSPLSCDLEQRTASGLFLRLCDAIRVTVLSPVGHFLSITILVIVCV